jgi:hypothetical protein
LINEISTNRQKESPEIDNSEEDVS